MQKIVECVPNFSEGRDPAVIKALCAEIEAAPVCGDGTIAGSEACDDGNASSGDGCSLSLIHI